ncbi:hypothetical protein [Candidatus Nephthysia bennettiae]|uniref:hypothetical protein n=1 Tax=Candidatus Nephthysia bennettiae TaxID=3127016 RepID=UPI0030C6C797
MAALAFAAGRASSSAAQWREAGEAGGGRGEFGPGGMGEAGFGSGGLLALLVAGLIVLFVVSVVRRRGVGRWVGPSGSSGPGGWIGPGGLGGPQGIPGSFEEWHRQAHATPWAGPAAQPEHTPKPAEAHAGPLTGPAIPPEPKTTAPEDPPSQRPPA